MRAYRMGRDIPVRWRIARGAVGHRADEADVAEEARRQILIVWRVGTRLCSGRDTRADSDHDLYTCSLGVRREYVRAYGRERTSAAAT